MTRPTVSWAELLSAQAHLAQAAYALECTIGVSEAEAVRRFKDYRAAIKEYGGLVARSTASPQEEQGS